MSVNAQLRTSTGAHVVDLTRRYLHDREMSEATRPELPRPPGAVIFDMDGVIFDTERMYQKSLKTAIEAAGSTISEEMLLETAGLSWSECRDMLDQNYFAVIHVDVLVAKWLRDFDALATKGLPLKNGLLELLDTLDALCLPRAIATSAYPEDAKRNLDVHGIRHRFDTVVAQGDCQATKPAPDPFLLAAKRLGVDPSCCLAIEDSAHGVRSAFDAGMMTVMVPDTVQAGEQEIARCVRVVRDLHEVRAMLTGE
jgi:HAD superfamily hydrolase (TIGR01509 family)